jgi:uncharacterized protein YjbI with pentapeptide repeats
MANPEHVERLKQGAEVWNVWRRGNPKVRPDLTLANLAGADLSHAALENADLRGTTLRFANLADANLGGADLRGASNLSYADLSGADLSHAFLSRADLSHAKLCGTRLFRVDLYDAILNHANLTEATLIETVFTNVDLSSVIGLEQCIDGGPSVIDHRTLQKSGPLPPPFLRGVGLPDNFIDYLPLLLNRAIQHYSCFISYSAKNQTFAKRLHADLQNKGVRCWFAPHDLRIGEKILDEIDAAIRLRDKVVLILSEHSIKSDWVGDEVTAGFEEERKRGQTVLFPVRLDDAVMDTKEAWAAKLRARLIGDFQNWKDHDAYKESFACVLRDLTIKPKVP